MTLLRKLLADRRLILASGSPRRQEFLKQLELPFQIRLKEIEEVYPSDLRHAQISEFLSIKKAEAFANEMKTNEILITADTIVWHKERALGKPLDREDAMKMLSSLSGDKHEVITSVCLTSLEKQLVFSDVTQVEFARIEPTELSYYIDNYQPYDKAGAYGIQEWIGYVGVRSIRGSYFNVVGFPVQKFYENLRTFLS